MQYFIGVAAGVIVGFSLALVGGGGSILAVPLIVYAVGVTDPHLAVGTSALAVAANAVAGLASHARAATVRWKIAGVFAAAGIIGAWLGSLAGKALAGPKLLACFAVLMLLVGVLMLRIPPTNGDSPADLGRVSVARLMMVGALTGAVSGFFGIGGGFLIVPGLMYAAHLPILEAVGSALVAVAAFGLTTAVNYARSGWIDWPVAAVFIGGGTLGSVAGTRFARRLAARQGALNRLYAAVVFLVALYMLFRSVTGNS
ncbi:MAG TPA: sulfite exporter TauE/SafE family protein [Steroidobacteraceae bacterium]